MATPDNDKVSSCSKVPEWQVQDVLDWANREKATNNVRKCLQIECIDGVVLLALTEDDIRDFRYRLNYNLTFAELKRLWLSVHALQQQHQETTEPAAACSLLPTPEATPLHCPNVKPSALPQTNALLCCGCKAENCVCETPSGSGELENLSPPMSVDGRATTIPPEFFKTVISLGYSFLVTWITAFVMVIVHERVPDMKRYPPLPDIFLDNVPHIPWAFHMCEITGTLLFTIWASVCIFHKYRMVLLRRFFAMAGTVFLLRCVTMLITSLSVPGTHLQCNRNDYAVDDSLLTNAEALELRISRAYSIWSGLGMSIQGVRTCGDYMFSGHTVALTLLNFFITEYTPRHLYFLHTLTWLLNMFGIFFILAAHEHYSIDVFVAFYITSRLFLYYHTLANNQALMQRDSNRTRIWFPMFSYFEAHVDGIIPNEYDSLSELLDSLMHYIIEIKDVCMQTAHRFSVDQPNMAMTPKNMLFVPNTISAGTNVDASIQKNAATSTNPSVCNTPTTLTSFATFGLLPSQRDVSTSTVKAAANPSLPIIVTTESTDVNSSSSNSISKKEL